MLFFYRIIPRVVEIQQAKDADKRFEGLVCLQESCKFLFEFVFIFN